MRNNEKGVMSMANLKYRFFSQMYGIQQLSINSLPLFVAYLALTITLSNPLLVVTFLLPLCQSSYLFLTYYGGLLLLCMWMVLLSLVGLLVWGMAGGKASHWIRGVWAVANVIRGVGVIVGVEMSSSQIKEGEYFMGLLNILGTLAFGGALIVLDIFDFNTNPKGTSIFHRRYSFSHVFSSISFSLLTVFLSVRRAVTLEYSFLTSTVCFIFLILVSSLKIKAITSLDYYRLTFCDQIYRVGIVCEAIFILTFFLYTVTSLSLFISNMLFVIGLLSILSFCSFQRYKYHRESYMQLNQVGDLSGESQASLYLQCLAKMAASITQNGQNIIMASLHKRHLLNCADLQCYCAHADTTYDFMREYIDRELTELCAVFPCNRIFFGVLYFKLLVFRFYPQVSSLLGARRQEQKSLPWQFTQHCLQRQLSQFISQQNAKIMPLNIQSAFQLQGVCASLRNSIADDIKGRATAWKYLSRNICRLTQIERSCEQIVSRMQKILRIKLDHLQTFKRSMEFILLLIFFYSKVALMPIPIVLRQILSEASCEVKEVELFDLQRFAAGLFNVQSCVIETMVGRNIGVITGACRNVERLFGMPTHQIVGTNMSKLMPEFLGVEHERVLQNWMQTGACRTVGKIKEIFCVHTFKHCFNALLYLKIYCKDDTICLIASLHKKNQDDFLLAQMDGKVVGMGRRFLDMVGEAGLILELGLLLDGEYGKNMKEIMGEIKSGKKTFTRKLWGVKQLKQEISTFLETNLGRSVRDKDAERRELHQIIHKSQEVYDITFTAKMVRLGKVSSLVICLKESSMEQKNEEIEELKKELSKTQKLGESRLNNASILTGTGDKEGFMLTQTAESFIEVVMDQKKLKNTRIKVVSTLVFGALFLLGSLNFMTSFLYKLKFEAIIGLFQADGAVSDVIQLTQICYCQLYTIYQMKNSSERQKIREMLVLNLQQLYGLIGGQFKDNLQTLTNIEKQKKFIYLEESTFWVDHLGNSSTGGTSAPQQITLLVFLQNFYYFSKLAAPVSPSISTLLTLSANFPELKRLNNYYLYYYSGKTSLINDQLHFISYLQIAVFAFLSFLLGFLVNHYLRFNFQQRSACANIFFFLSSLHIQCLSAYYTSLASQSELLSNITKRREQLQGINVHEMFQKSKNTSLNRGKLANYESYGKWVYILGVILCLSALNYTVSTPVSGIQSTVNLAFAAINKLLEAQNFFIESYLDVKSKYYLDAKNITNTDFPGQVEFLSWAQRLTDVLIGLDDTFKMQFAQLLVQSVCEVARGALSDAEYVCCFQAEKGTVFQGGILLAMDYSMRHVQQAYVDVFSNRAGDNYFLGEEFLLIDKMIIPMFRVYTALQVKLYSSLSSILLRTIAKSLWLNTVMMVSLLLLAALWMRIVKRQRKQLVIYNGYPLLVPFNLLKTHKQILTAISFALECER